MLNQSCQYLKGVGPKIAELLAKCDIATVQDILFHLPLRYEDRTQLTPIRKARIGQTVLVEGVIVAKNPAPFRAGGKKSTLIDLNDQTGFMHLRFFHLSKPQEEQLTIGTRLRCYGEVRFSPGGVTLFHPEYEILTDAVAQPIEQTLTPVYSTTAGLTQKRWQQITYQALQSLEKNSLDDYLHTKTPWSLKEALNYVHRPSKDADLITLNNHEHPAQLRLALEELTAHHLSLRMRKQKLKKETAPLLSINHSAEQALLQQLPFKLTNAQQRVIQEISHDLAKTEPMLRLVQGDVGSGKTVVAAFAAQQAMSNNYQVAIMAPTELLAEQHFKNFSVWMAPQKIAYLTSNLNTKDRQQLLDDLISGNIAVVVGTHALFQSDVHFKQLGLVIIDEQHRFGVGQRLALKEKGLSPHQLIMTATPIPRTLAMTFYADLSLSVIDELPPGRTPIQTIVLSQDRREEIITRIKHICAQGQQVYWVCTLIEESEELNCQAAEVTAQMLHGVLKELHIGLLHGRLKSAEKEKIMLQFKKGEINLLVATTVVEVGVDVPNATLMIIENAERLGLAQLHQLRGRVGRGNLESYCVLLYQAPLSPHARERLQVMRESQDGFVIAEKDLKIRGPGELLGTRQTGMVEFRVADLARDQHLFGEVSTLADELLAHHPKNIMPLIQRWLGNIERYQQV